MSGMGTVGMFGGSSQIDKEPKAAAGKQERKYD